MARKASKEEYEHLCRVIQRWNEHRVELFEISMPNESLEFEGIMRFYFQSVGGDGQKVATKCIRVSNNATTEMVIEALVQKFRPDLRMLTGHSYYALYEVHADHGERKIGKDEYPLLVQLGWIRGEREGRFLLRREVSEIGFRGLSKADRRTQKEQSKRDKRVLKKKKSKRSEVEIESISEEERGSIARSLYNDMPESRFTRSISLKNKRNQIPRIEKRRSSFQYEADFDDGTVQVGADFIIPDVPSKTLLISAENTVAQVVKSAVEKYGIREDPREFCLVQVNVLAPYDGQMQSKCTERILGDNECPLQIHGEWTSSTGSTQVQFQLRRRASFIRRGRRHDSHSRSRSPENDPTLPALVEMFQGVPSPPQTPRRFLLSLDSTEIGSNSALLDSKSCLCLSGTGIKPRHCVISCTQGIFTISPLDKLAVTYVNNKPVKEPTFLPHYAIVRLGEKETFRFFVPAEAKSSSTSMHTLPIGVSGARREIHTRARPENLSKAYSVEDICNPSLSQHRGIVTGRLLKDRAYSEYNLKDGPAVGYPPGHSRRKFSEPAFISEGDVLNPGSKKHPKVGGVDLEGGAGPEWPLPASIPFYPAQQPLLLQGMISDVNGYLLQFKLGPAYGLYMALKHHLSPEYQPSASSVERRKCLLLTLKTIMAQIRRAVKDSRNIAGALAFWMANTSELLHFLKRDYQLSQFSGDYEASLTQIILSAYKQFTQCMLKELNIFLPAFYDDSSEADSEEGYVSGGEGNGIGKDPDVVPVPRPSIARQSSITGMYWSVAGSKIRRRGRPTIGDILSTLSSTISLLKRCRVNATLSILIFSVLFRYISTRLFNKLVSEAKYCSVSVGVKLRKRLDRVKVWAEKEGMELPAENHLTIVVQAANLIQANKQLPEEAQAIFSTCSKLNSRQIGTLLHYCSIAEGEPVNQAFVEGLILLAKSHASELTQGDGTELNLEEDPNLELPFLIPQQGYSCDTFRGIPPGLQDFLEPMISGGLCKWIVNKDASGLWFPPLQTSTSTQSLGRSLSPRSHDGSNPNVSLSNTLPRVVGHSHRAETESRGTSTLPRQLDHTSDLKILRMTITKEHNSLGISIVGGKNSVAHGDLGIFVKSLIEGGAAFSDGRLKTGDQIMRVDNTNLDGCTQEQAAQILRATGKEVTLIVAKQAAAYYGLSNLIHQPSPRYNRKHEPHLPEGSSHARKAMRRQKREQRDRERQQTSRQDKYPHHEFRLERRKSDFTEPSRTPAASHVADPARQPPDSRHPAYDNPQFAKWIMEQNTLYGSEKGSRVDIQSSMPSLTNIPERDRAGSPVSSYVTTSTRHTSKKDSSDRGYYKPSTPPVRDSGPSRPADYVTPYSNFSNADTSDMHSVSDTGSKYSEYSAEPDHQIQPVSAPPFSSSRPHLPPNFSTLSSQMTVGSQQMLTPYSQQQNPSQQQQQLDGLSMDVLYHTQQSTASGPGILALLPKPSSKPARLRHLDSSNLKELEVDEIDLEKQRIHMMRSYEEQKQRGCVIPGSSPTTIARRNESPLAYQVPEAHPQHNQAFTGSRATDEIFAEMDRSLLRELESLEQMVSEQKKKCRELKMAKEREERNLKQADKQLREPEIMNGALDQHRWQKEQMRKLRELERVKAEQSERFQQFEYDEHRAKNKLKAYEVQASEIRQQLLRGEPASQVLPPRTPGAGEEFNGMDSRGLDMFPHQDLLPTKLTSDHVRSSHGGGVYRDGVHPEAERPMKLLDHDHMTTPAERDWMDSNSVKPVSASSRVMSVDSVTTSTWVAPEQPDISREIATTMSESNLTEPTQDDLPTSSVWSGSSPKPSRDLRNFMQSPDLYSTTSNSKISITEETLSQEERLRRLKEESRSNSNGILVGSKEERDLHVAQLQQEAMEQPRFQEYSTRLHRLPSGTHVPNQGSYGNSTNVEPPVNHVPTNSADPWKQQPPHRAPPQSWGNQHQYAQPQAYHQHYAGQPAHQYSGRTNHHYSRNNRSRSHSRGPQQSNMLYAVENSTGSMHGLHEHPLQDSTSRTSTTPDLIPTSFNSRALSPRSSNPPRQLQTSERSFSPRQLQTSERSFSPLSKFSDHSAVPQSSSYAPQALQHAVSTQREREHSYQPSHPPPLGSPSLKQEVEIQSKSPTETSRSRSALSTSSNAPEKYPSPAWQMPARSPISPTRPPAHDTTSKITNWSHDSAARSHDHRTASHYDRPQHPSEPARAQNVPERDIHQPKAPATHRYGTSRPEVKGNPGLGHSYARRRPPNTTDPTQQMSLKAKVKLWSYKTQAPRHPERIQRQQTEL